MEEDIKILEDYIKLIKKGYCLDCNELCNIYTAPAFPSGVVALSLENLIKGYRELEEEIKILREYIIIAPNLDEMTALKYAHIQESAYFRGRAEEQQRANETIHKHFIPKSKIKEKIEEYKQEMKEIRAKEKGLIWNHRLHKLDYAIQELQELTEDK